MSKVLILDQACNLQIQLVETSPDPPSRAFLRPRVRFSALLPAALLQVGTLPSQLPGVKPGCSLTPRLPRPLRPDLTLVLTSGQPCRKAWHCQHASVPSRDTALMSAAAHCARLRRLL